MSVEQQKTLNISYDYNISKHKSWRVGGIVKCFFVPHSLAQLQDFLLSLPAKERIIWLGLGSNVLFPDGCLDATVIVTTKCFSGIVAHDLGCYTIAAGTSCAKVAKQVVKDGYKAAAFFAGIPGTVGGAIRMNAGAFASETWRFLESFKMLSRNGCVEIFSSKDIVFSYRNVLMPSDGCITAGYFNFATADNDTSENIKSLLQRRNTSQPIGSFNCGSVFKNPPSGYAAQLIEACGLKGIQIGDAIISQKHANFIINLGAASAEDVISLITLVTNRVLAKFDILLEPEVKIFKNEE